MVELGLIPRESIIKTYTHPAHSEDRARARLQASLLDSQSSALSLAHIPLAPLRAFRGLSQEPMAVLLPSQGHLTSSGSHRMLGWASWKERLVKSQCPGATSEAAGLHDLHLASSCLEEQGLVCTVLLPMSEPFHSQVLWGQVLSHYHTVAYTWAGQAPDPSHLPGEARCPSGPGSPSL